MRENQPQRPKDSGAAESSPQPLQELANGCRQELTRLQAEMMEIDVLIKQTTAELERLGPRVAQMARKLHEIESQAESYSRAEIREAYSAAQEAQMRQFLMQTQLDQLTHKKSNLQRYDAHLRKVLATLPDVSSIAQAGGQPASAVAEQQWVADYSASAAPDDFATAQVIQAQEEQRHLVAQEILEGPAQLLSNLVLRAEICERLLAAGDQRALEELRQIKQSIANSLRDTRRFVYELRPVVIGELGLAATLQKYVQVVAERAGVTIAVEGDGLDLRLPSFVELAVFRIAQDAISQSLSRRQVSSVTVRLTASDATLELIVEDDGMPDLGERRPPGEGRGQRPRPTSLRERLRLLRATADAEVIPGGGHRLRIAIPLPRPQ